MKKLSKQDLHLMASAGSMEALESVIKSKLYWAKAEFTPSNRFESRLGQCYDVTNLNGMLDTCVVIKDKSGRFKLYSL